MNNSNNINIGVLIDVSRGAVMNFSFFKEMIDSLSLMGYKFVEIYSEDLFEVKDEPFLGYLRGKYSVEELQRMDDYAYNKGIELIPCIQTLAHFTSLSKAEKINNGLFDIDDILLVDSERTYVFLENIIKTCRKAFRSNIINIGMDEASKIGQGNYLLKNGYEKKTDIIIKHLNKISEITEKYNYECQMWSDMFIQMVNSSNDHKTEINHISKLIPDNITLIYWDYTNTDVYKYNENFSLHNKLSNKVAFAGGAWCWRGFAPLNFFTLKTMEPAIKSCIENNIQTVIITLWGDDGNETSKLATLPSLFACSQYSKGNFDLALIKNEFKELFGIPFDSMMELDLPNCIYKNGIMMEDFFVPCKPLFYQDPFMGKVDYLLDLYDKIDYKKYGKILRNNSKIPSKYSLLFKEECLLCEYLSHKAYLGYNLRKAYINKDKKELIKSIKQFSYSIKTLKRFKRVFEKLWFAQNKSYGFEVHDMRIGGLIERLKTCKSQLKKHIKTGLIIEELEEPLINYFYDDKFWPNNHRDIVSNFVI